ncbi:hypothetical protein TNCV_76581 [Trichonephila clavipes]|nr:hypothetical protein TNCV_76581 [Trichonephila clavipes]
MIVGSSGPREGTTSRKLGPTTHWSSLTEKDDSVDGLHWPARSADFFPIENEWDIIERELQRHPQPELNALILTDLMQQACNSIPQISGIRTRCIQDSGGNTCN